MVENRAGEKLGIAPPLFGGAAAGPGKGSWRGSAFHISLGSALTCPVMPLWTLDGFVKRTDNGYAALTDEQSNARQNETGRFVLSLSSGLWINSLSVVCFLWTHKASLHHLVAFSFFLF